MKEVCLEWVVVNSETQHVSEFAHLPPMERPEAFCPECGKSIIFKLGKEKAHHAAHHEGAICAATQPETALHINAKHHVKNILKSSNELLIYQSCKGWKSDNYKHSCVHENKRATSYIRDWDQVEDEWQFGIYRLDIALLKNGEVIGAVEILVTHPTEKEKIEYLNKQKIAWVEIKVDTNFYSKPSPWQSDTPLPPEKYNKTIINEWQCSNCLKYMEEDKARAEQERLQKQEAERKKAFAQQFKALQARYVDLYFPSGKKYRSVYVIQARLQDSNQFAYLELQEVGSTRRTLAREYPPILDSSYVSLRKVFDEQIEKLRNSNKVVDDSSQWDVKLERFHPKKYLNSDYYPYNYNFINGKWQNNYISNDDINISNKTYYVQNEEDQEDEEEISTKQIAQIDIPHLVREFTCEKCGKKTTDWLSAKLSNNTCICRECTYKTK